MVAKYKGRVNYHIRDIDLPFGGGVVFVGKFGNSKRLEKSSFPIGSAWSELTFGVLNTIPSWKRLNLRLPQIDSGLTPYHQAARLADSANAVERQQAVLEAVEYVDDDEQAARLIEDLNFVAEQEPETVDPDRGAEIRRRIVGWKSQPATAALFERPAALVVQTVDPAQLRLALDELRPAIETAALATQGGTGVAALSAAGRNRAGQIAQAIDRDAAQLKLDFGPFVPQVAAVGAYLDNAGDVGGDANFVHLPDLNGTLQNEPELLIKALESFQLPFLDIVLCDDVSEAAAESLIAVLGTRIHGALYLGSKSYASPRQLAARLGTRKATQSHSLVFTCAGKGRFRNVDDVLLAAAAAGLRKRLDGTGYRIFEPLFGRKAPKELRGFTEVDTFGMDKDEAMAIAQTTGLNMFIHNELSNVQTLALDRSRSSLSGATQFSQNRGVQMVLGSIRSYLAMELVAKYDDPVEVAEILRMVADKFFGHFHAIPGFAVKLLHRGSLTPGEVNLLLNYAMSDPIESFNITVSSDPKQPAA